MRWWMVWIFRGSKLPYLILLLSSVANAKEIYGPEAGVVPFAMGRAYSAVADDWLALYYNPAGLAMVNRVEVQPFDLKLGANRDVITAKDTIDSISDSSRSVAGVLNSFAGKTISANVSNFSQITVPHFALGMSYEVNAAIDVQNTANPQVDMRYTKDLSFAMGAAAGVGKRKDFRIGTRLEYVSRVGGDRKLPLSELVGNRATLIDSFKANGTGIAGTVGIQYRLPTNGRTEFNTSFVWHDIGKTSFGSKMSQSRPSRIDENMVAGLAIRLPIGGKKNRRLERRYGPSRSTNHLTFAADYSHLNYSLDKEHLPKHLHFGMNLDLPLLSIQAGVNQTSLTFGASFDIGILRVAAATYGEEMGSYGGQKRDRRYILSVGSSLGFKGF
jgi:hypothetical protein